MMRLCLSARGAAMLAMLVPAPGISAATSNATPAELRSDVTRLQGVVAQCSGMGAACDPSAVGDDLRIGDAQHGGYEVHWDWLRDSLKKGKDAEAGKRAGMLEEPASRLAAMADELDTAGEQKSREEGELGQARGRARSVLAQAEFQRDERKTWWDRAKAHMAEWIFKILEGLQHVGTAAPWLGQVLEWLLFIGAGVGLLFFLLRNLSRQRLRISMEGAALQTTAWDREATDWARLAEKYAGEGKWRDAVHCLYWAAIVSLEARRAWRHNPTRTPREYLRLLKPGSPQQRGLRGLTQIFERVWYGLRDAHAEEYDEARSLYEGLAAGKSSFTVDAPGALEKGGTV